LYAHGIGPQPTAAAEAKLDQIRFLLINEQLTKGPLGMVQMLGVYGAAVNVQGLPGGGMTAAPQMAARLFGRSLFRLPDLGPPALPILMERAARRAVAENPLDVQSRLALINANDMLRKMQEDYWIQHQANRGPHPARLRDRLRQIQVIANLSALVQLPALGPQESFKYHTTLSELYKQQNLWDLALEQMQDAQKGLETWKSHGKNAPKELD